MSYTEKDLIEVPVLEETGIPLLRKVWEGIKADSRAWNQGVWIGVARGGSRRLDDVVVDYIKANRRPPWNCGTAYCVAGHVALAKGAVLPRGEVKYVAKDAFSMSIIIRPEDIEEADAAYAESGYEGPYTTDVDDYARDMMGLSYGQAQMLFSESNDAYAIELMVRALEINPDARLSQTRTWDDNRDAWMIEHGFIKPMPLVHRLRAALDHAYPYLHNVKYLALVARLRGVSLNGADVYQAQLLYDGDDEDNRAAEYADLPAQEREEFVKLAGEIRAIVVKVSIATA